MADFCRVDVSQTLWRQFILTCPRGVTSVPAHTAGAESECGAAVWILEKKRLNAPPFLLLFPLWWAHLCASFLHTGNRKRETWDGVTETEQIGFLSLLQVLRSSLTFHSRTRTREIVFSTHWNLLTFQNLVPTIPTMQLNHWATSHAARIIKHYVKPDWIERL